MQQYTGEDLLVRSEVRNDGPPLLLAVEQNKALRAETILGVRLVTDLQTGEGLIVDVAQAEGRNIEDEVEHKSRWLCPLAVPFLKWLYEKGPVRVAALPSLVELPPGSMSLQGYRRAGPVFGDGIGTIRGKLLAALRTISNVPLTMVQATVWMQEQLNDEEWFFLKTYRETLTPAESTRWIGSLMAESGRYVSVGLGRQIAMIPHEQLR